MDAPDDADVVTVPSAHVRHIARDLATEAEHFRRWIDSVGPGVRRSAPRALKRQRWWRALFLSSGSAL